MKRLLASGLCAAAVGLAPGCTAISEIVGVMTGRPAAVQQTDLMTAADLDVRAWLAGAWWAAVQAEGADIVADPATPETVKDAIRRADAAGSPVIVKLTYLAEAYGAARDAGAPAGDIDAAGARLDAGIDAANEKVVALAAAMGMELDLTERDKQ